jgi:hypothetical protein
MASGLVQIAGDSQTRSAMMSETIADAMTALAIILAMSVGLIVPKLLVDYLYERSKRVKS